MNSYKTTRVTYDGVKFLVGFIIIHYHTQEQIKANKIQNKNNIERQPLYYENLLVATY